MGYAKEKEKISVLRSMGKGKKRKIANISK